MNMKDRDQEENDQTQKHEKGNSRTMSENDSSSGGGHEEDKSVQKTDSGEKSSFLSNFIAFISFGLAVLALFFVFTVMKKVDNNIGQIKSSVKTLEAKTSSFKAEVNEKLGYVDFEIDDLKSKVKKSQRMAAIVELKRALVTVQDASLVESSPELKAKSRQLVSNIESFLQDLHADKKGTLPGKIEVMEEPVSAPKIK